MLWLLFWCFAGVKTQLVELHPLEYQGNPALIFSVAHGEGHLYLACPTQGDILHFDEKGRALPAIGKKGQGPGEFNWPGVVFFRAPYLYVFDGNQQKLFRIDPKTGTFLKHWSLKGAEALSVKGDELFTAFVDSQKDKVLGIASLGGDLKFRRLLGDPPCCLNVSGSQKGAVLHASDGSLWGTFSGEYKLLHFTGDGDLLKSITQPPLDYVTPAQGKEINRFDTTALSNNVRSFDKMGGLYEYGSLILLYRYKTLSNSSLDIYTKAGAYRATLKADKLKPVDVIDQKLYVIKETPADSQWDIELCSLSIQL